MATVNRYDSPAQSQVINTYSPIPFQEIQQAALARQAYHDQSLAIEDDYLGQLGGPALEQIPLAGISGNVNVQDRALVDATTKRLEEQLANLSTQAGTSDKGDPSYRRALRSAYRDLQKAKKEVYDPAAANVKTYQEYQKYLRENPDIQKAPWLANQLNRQLMQFSNTTGDRISMLQAPAAIGEYVNRLEVSDDAIKGIGSILSNMIDNPQEALAVEGYIQTGKMEGVPTWKVQKAIREYLSTSNPVTQDIEAQREMLSQYSNMNDSEIDNYINKEVQNIEDYLVAKHTSSEGSFNMKSDATALKESDSKPKFESILSTYRPNLAATKGLKIDDTKQSRVGSSTNKGLYYDENGSLQAYDAPSGTTISKKGPGQPSVSGNNVSYNQFVSNLEKELGRPATNNDIKTKAEKLNLNNFVQKAEADELVSNLRTNYNIPSNVNDKTLVKAYEAKAMDLATTSATVNRPLTTDTKSYNKLDNQAEFLFGSGSDLGDLATGNRKIIIQEGPGKEKAAGDWSTFVDALGFRKDLNEDSKASATISGFKIFDDNIPGAIEFAVTNKKGKIVKGVIEPSLQVQAALQPITQIYQAVKDVTIGDETSKVIEFGPNTYEVNSQWTGNGFSTQILEYSQENPNGKPITLDEIGNAGVKVILDRF